MLDSLLHLTRAGDLHSVRELAVLGTLVEQPQINGVRELAKHLNVAKPVITRACDLLVAEALVTRETDSNDRRCVVLRATKAGQKLWKAAHAAEREMRRAA